MNPQIKVRAWDGQQMLMALEINEGSTTKPVFNMYSDRQAKSHPKFHKFMLWTGLQDKQKVDIFEGDIVQCDDTIMVVKRVWDDKVCGFIFHQETHEEAHTPTSECLVIGNVYENSNLLKGGEDE